VDDAAVALENVYRTFGAEVEVIAGLEAGDAVVVHPGDDIPEGTAVEPVPLPK
jgi:hypothetical protein